MQLVFEPELPPETKSYLTSVASQLPPELSAAGLSVIPFGAHHYFLFQHSYLGFGLHEASKSIREYLIRTSLTSASDNVIVAQSAAASSSNKKTCPRETVPIFHPCWSVESKQEFRGSDGCQYLFSGKDISSVHSDVSKGHHHRCHPDSSFRSVSTSACDQIVRGIFHKDLKCHSSSSLKWCLRLSLFLSDVNVSLFLL